MIQNSNIKQTENQEWDLNKLHNDYWMTTNSGINRNTTAEAIESNLMISKCTVKSDFVHNT